MGRYKLNQRLGLPDTEDSRTLTDNDILTAIKVLVQLKDSHGPADDIDHLGNRRVRLVGELVECAPTQQIFSMPADKRTEDYITGRFG